jgi:hypothetical protein
MKMKNWILIAILLVSQVTLAREQISKRKIHQVNVYANYAIVTLATPNFSNTDGCTHSNAKRSVGIDLNAAGGKEQRAAVLTARASGQDIGFGTNGCINWGDPTVQKVYRVDF